jgi:hypothetical protein
MMNYWKSYENTRKKTKSWLRKNMDLKFLCWLIFNIDLKKQNNFLIDQDSIVTSRVKNILSIQSTKLQKK